MDRLNYKISWVFRLDYEFFFLSTLFFLLYAEEVEEESGSGAGQEEYMKEQQAKLAAERQKLMENRDMVESVSTFFYLDVPRTSKITKVTLLRPIASYNLTGAIKKRDL